MPDAEFFHLKPHFLQTVAAVAFSVAAVVFISWLAWTGDTDLRPLRGLPLSQENKVAMLWGLAAVSTLMPVMALLKIKAILYGVSLEVGEDYVVLPYGLGLRKRARLLAGEVLEVEFKDYGGGDVLHVRWAGGNAYLPLAWFVNTNGPAVVMARLEALARS